MVSFQMRQAARRLDGELNRRQRLKHRASGTQIWDLEALCELVVPGPEELPRLVLASEDGSASGDLYEIAHMFDQMADDVHALELILIPQRAQCPIFDRLCDFLSKNSWLELGGSGEREL
jgi:hypothetical protein